MKIKATLFFVITLMCVFPPNSTAQTAPLNEEIAITDFTNLANLPVKYSDEYTRYDTFAERIIKETVERQVPENINPTEWLTQLIFNDPRAFEIEIFTISNPDIRKKLKLQNKETFTLNEIISQEKPINQLYAQIIEIDEEYRGDPENEIIRLHKKFQRLINLSQSFGFAMPNPSLKLSSTDIKKELNLSLGQEYFSYLDIVLVANKLLEHFDQLTQKDRNTWTATETEIFTLVQNLYSYTAQQNTESALRIIASGENKILWLNPVEFVNRALSGQDQSDIIVLFKNMYEHATAGNQEEFDWTINQLADYNKAIYTSSSDHTRIDAVIKSKSLEQEKPNLAYIVIFVLIFLGMIILIVKNK